MPNSDIVTPPAALLQDILGRRSINGYTDDSVTADELDAILRAATTVPDHGGLRPWRFVVIEGSARAAFGEALVDAGRQVNPELPDKVADKLRSKAFVAPMLIAVCARVDASAAIPAWEQVASASCAGYAIALAAHRLGLGAMWKSSPFHDGPELAKVLDMSGDDQFLGWVNIGRIAEGRVVAPRDEIDLDPIVRRLTADGSPVAYSPS